MSIDMKFDTDKYLRLIGPGCHFDLIHHLNQIAFLKYCCSDEGFRDFKDNEELQIFFECIDLRNLILHLSNKSIDVSKIHHDLLFDDKSRSYLNAIIADQFPSIITSDLITTKFHNHLCLANVGMLFAMHEKGLLSMDRIEMMVNKPNARPFRDRLIHFQHSPLERIYNRVFQFTKTDIPRVTFRTIREGIFKCMHDEELVTSNQLCARMFAPLSSINTALLRLVQQQCIIAHKNYYGSQTYYQLSPKGISVAKYEKAFEYSNQQEENMTTNNQHNIELNKCSKTNTEIAKEVGVPSIHYNDTNLNDIFTTMVSKIFNDHIFVAHVKYHGNVYPSITKLELESKSNNKWGDIDDTVKVKTPFPLDSELKSITATLRFGDFPPFIDGKVIMDKLSTDYRIVIGTYESTDGIIFDSFEIIPLIQMKDLNDYTLHEIKLADETSIKICEQRKQSDEFQFKIAFSPRDSEVNDDTFLQQNDELVYKYRKSYKFWEEYHKTKPETVNIPTDIIQDITFVDIMETEPKIIIGLIDILGEKDDSTRREYLGELMKQIIITYPEYARYVFSKMLI